MLSTLSDHLEQIYPAPWARGEWTGELISADGASAADFEEEDVAHVVWWASTDADDWDGYTAGVVVLKDGRYVAWEADWGPTGNGFSYDAYGGTADIIFARSQAAAEAYLSDEAKQLPRVIVIPGE